VGHSITKVNATMKSSNSEVSPQTPQSQPPRLDLVSFYPRKASTGSESGFPATISNSLLTYTGGGCLIKTELSERSSGLYRLLKNAAIYGGLMASVRKPAAKDAWVRDFIRPDPQMSILDVGSGTSSILTNLGDVHYVGIEPNKAYVEEARSRFGDRGEFHVGSVQDIRAIPGDFNTVLAVGVLHHLNDSEVHEFFSAARAKLVAGGRIVTLDGGYVPGQSRASRFVVSRDRGGNVRNMWDYANFAIKQGLETRVYYTNSLLRIPYSHVALICHNSELQ
jgi:hypothetical protein